MIRETHPKQSTTRATFDDDRRRKLAEIGSTANGNELRGDDSLFRALVSGCHIENAAVAAGVSERTAYRRLADPEFRNQIDQARQSLRESILAKLADAGHDAIGVLTGLMHDGEDDATRLKAAKAVLDSLLAVQRNENSQREGNGKSVQSVSSGVVVYLPDNGRELSALLPKPPVQVGPNNHIA